MMPGANTVTAGTDDVVRSAGVTTTSRRSWWARLNRWSGLAGRPPAVLALTTVVIVAALTAMLLSATRSGQPSGSELPLAARIGIAVALTAGAQLARIRLRLGRRTLSLCGGETAFILGFALLPAGWLPAVTFVGVAAAGALISVFSDQRPPVEIVHVAASLTLGVAGAAAVTSRLAGAEHGALTPAYGLALVAGCGTFLVITSGLAIVTLGLHRDVPLGPAVVRILHGKLPMFVGNTLLGLFALVALRLEPRWLLLVPPAVWLLHRTYRLHLRAEDERRLRFACDRAVRSLGGASLGGESRQGMAVAGVRGTLDVFGAQRVRLTLGRPGDPQRSWVGDGSGEIVEIEAVPAAQPEPVRHDVVTRVLSAADAPIGELTLWLPPATPWTTRDDLALSAYGDSLASALHDADAAQQLADLHARIDHQAAHDPLTGLLNRRALLTRGDQVLATLDRKHPVALLLLDVNGFKHVNGTLGWNAGDELLKVLGERLTGMARERDLVARLGDDEFVLLLPQVTVLTDSSAPPGEAPSAVPPAMRRAHELLGRLAVPTEIAGVRLATEAAVGVVVAKAGCCDVSELIRRAEIALGQAKQSQISVVTYEDSHDTSSTDQLAMLAELGQALQAEDQLVLALQPAVDLATGVPTGVEALSRWHHPRRGLLPPVDFIRVVEHSELLAPFTRYVLDRSLAAAATWAAAGLELPVSVNVAARSLLDRTFPGQVAEALRQHAIPPRLLVLEITETVAVSEQPIVEEVVTALREVGVQLSVDDFGTGYSSLAFLDRMPVDELKVDRSFVAGMGESPRSAAIVQFAVELGRRLDLRVVAEGVETADQRAALLELGCTSAQGYHFCKPLPADKIVEALRALGKGVPAKVVPLRADGAS